MGQSIKKKTINSKKNFSLKNTFKGGRSAPPRAPRENNNPLKNRRGKGKTVPTRQKLPAVTPVARDRDRARFDGVAARRSDRFDVAARDRRTKLAVAATAEKQMTQVKAKSLLKSIASFQPSIENIISNLSEKYSIISFIKIQEEMKGFNSSNKTQLYDDKLVYFDDRLVYLLGINDTLMNKLKIGDKDITVCACLYYFYTKQEKDAGYSDDANKKHAEHFFSLLSADPLFAKPYSELVQSPIVDEDVDIKERKELDILLLLIDKLNPTKDSENINDLLRFFTFDYFLSDTKINLTETETDLLLSVATSEIFNHRSTPPSYFSHAGVEQFLLKVNQNAPKKELAKLESATELASVHSIKPEDKSESHLTQPTAAEVAAAEVAAAAAATKRQRKNVLDSFYTHYNTLQGMGDWRWGLNIFYDTITSKLGLSSVVGQPIITTAFIRAAIPYLRYDHIEHLKEIFYTWDKLSENTRTHTDTDTDTDTDWKKPLYEELKTNGFVKNYIESAGAPSVAEEQTTWWSEHRENFKSFYMKFEDCLDLFE